MEVLKPFDLKLAKEGAQVKTKSGKNVRILTFDRKGKDGRSIVALIENGSSEYSAYFNESGECGGCEQNNLKIVAEVPDRWRDRNEDVIEYYLNYKNETVVGPSKFNKICGYASDKEMFRGYAAQQLSFIIGHDERFGGEVTDKEWDNDEIEKYCICRHDNMLMVVTCRDKWHYLAFHTKEQRDLFFKENEDLVKQYFML